MKEPPEPMVAVHCRSSIAAFTLRCCHDNTEVQMSQNYVNWELEGLEPGTDYTFQVRASNQQGHSEWSDESLPVTTKTSKSEIPEPPAFIDSGIDWIKLNVHR